MCAVGIGFSGHLGIRKEASFASGGSVDHWQPFTSESIELSYANVYTDQVRNTAEQVGGQRGVSSVAGNISFNVTPQGPTEWWQCGLGQASSVFYVERPLDSLLLQIDRETGCVQASGCMIGDMSFNSSQGGVLGCSVSIEGAGLGSCSAGSPSYTEEDVPYLHHEAVFSLNGTSDTSVTTFSVSISNSLGTDLYGTGTDRVEIPAGKLIVTGSFTKLFDDVVERNAFLNAQERSFNVTFTRGGTFFAINCPNIRYNSRPANISSQSEYILETFNFTSYVNDASTEKSIQISGDFVA